MKLYPVILFLLLSCKFGQEKGQQYSRTNSQQNELISYYPVPLNEEISIDYKVNPKSITYYFFNKDTLNGLSDSLKMISCRTIASDTNNTIDETIYNWYESIVPSTALSIYDHSGKILEYYYKNDEKTPSEGATKTTYYYDDQKRLTRTVSFDFEKRLRKDVDKGFGRAGGCIITEKDYEKYKSWEIFSVWNYKYDQSGKLVEKFAPIFNSTQNRYTYKYDEKGRLIEERSLENERLIWVESYVYYDLGHEFTRTWFENGQRRKDYDGKYHPIDTFRYKIDKFGNETDELVIEEGGRQVSRHKKYYDEKNRIIRNEIYDENDKLLGFYSHKYLDNGHPVSKKFYVSRD